MFLKKTGFFSRRKFLEAFSGLVSAGALLIGSSGSGPFRKRIGEILGEIEADALIRSAPIREKGFSCRNEGNGFVLVNESTSQEVCRFNETGRYVWDLCNGKETPLQISRFLNAAYEVAPDRAYLDCLFFLAGLKGKGAIRV
ncbi:MAG: PqqD family protein [Desulfobacteraceae bacterium]|nr:MAG: PqqD family protein [Desulfobacteraceae bacterium]